VLDAFRVALYIVSIAQGIPPAHKRGNPMNHMTAIRRMNADIAYKSYMDAYRAAKLQACREARMQRMTYGTRHHAEQLARRDAANLRAERHLANAIAIASVTEVRFGETPQR